MDFSILLDTTGICWLFGCSIIYFKDHMVAFQQNISDPKDHADQTNKSCRLSDYMPW